MRYIAILVIAAGCLCLFVLTSMVGCSSGRGVEIVCVGDLSFAYIWPGMGGGAALIQILEWDSALHRMRPRYCGEGEYNYANQ